MGVFKKNGWWWIDYYDTDGRRHREKASLENRIAKNKLKEKLGSIARGDITGIREEGILLKDFIEKKYWSTVKENLSASEQARSRFTIDKHIIPALGGMRLSKIRREDIERFQADRLAAVSAGTVKKEMMRLRHVLNRAVSWRYIRETPAKGVPTVAAPPGRIRYLSTEERNKLLQCAGPELALYLQTALQTGGRLGELASLRWCDIDMKARTLIFAKTKNGEIRVVPLTDTLREALQALPRPIDPQAKILPCLTPGAISLRFHRLTKTLNIPNLRFHDLRHDVASTLTMAGVPQRAVMEILGHKDPRMTLRYQHLTPEHLQRAMAHLNAPEKDTRPTAQTGS